MEGRNFPQENPGEGNLLQAGVVPNKGIRTSGSPVGIRNFPALQNKGVAKSHSPARIPTWDIFGTSKHFPHFSLTTAFQPSIPKKAGRVRDLRNPSLLSRLSQKSSAPRVVGNSRSQNKWDFNFFFLSSQKSYGCNRPSLDLQINRSSFVPQGPSQQLEKPPAQMFPVRPGIVIP